MSPASESAIHMFHFSPPEFDTGVSLYAAGSFSLTKESGAGLALPAFKGFALLAVLAGRLEVSDEATEALDGPYAVLLRTQDDIPRILRAVPAAEGALIAFGGPVPERIAEQFPPRAFAPFELHPEAPLLHELNTAVSDARNGLISDAHQGASRVYALLCELCRELERVKASQGSTLVEQAAAAIRERYAYLYGVDDLAESLGVSKHHLIREFTRLTGCSPGRFLTGTRIGNAKHLLRSSNYSVEVIGQLVGYANGNYFCKVFKRQTGMTPKEFRKCSLPAQPDELSGHIFDTEP